MEVIKSETIREDQLPKSANALDLPEIHLYDDRDFKGKNIVAYGSVAYVGDDFNDKCSSIIIVRGYWSFYLDAGFKNQSGKIRGPGEIPYVEDAGIKTDAISSFKFEGYLPPK